MTLETLKVGPLTKTFGRTVALDEVSFEIRPNETLGIIGPNGAGKTTLFECLAGILPVDQGGVVEGSRSLTRREQSDRLFYVPDQIGPWPSETVKWALDFTIGFFGGVRERLDAVITALRLQPLLKTRLGALSKGQRKRALLAVGLLTPQPILLIDEPFEGLDLRQRREVADALASTLTDGRTLVLSIHQISEAARVCDRFVLLSGGRVRGEGTAEELASLVGTREPAGSAIDLEDLFLALT